MSKKGVVLDPISVGHLPQQVLQQIETIILSGQLKEGDKLPTEQELSRQAGIGRRAIREALKALEMKGLVEIRRGSGTFVKRTDMEAFLGTMYKNIHAYLASDRAQLLHVLQFRQIVSNYAIRELTRKPAAAVLSVLEETLNVQKLALAANRPDLYHEAHLKFHMEIIKSLNNPIVTMIYTPVLQLIVGTMRESGSHREVIEKSIREHWQVFKAIQRGDQESALRAFEKHMQTSRQNLTEEQKRSR